MSGVYTDQSIFDAIAAATSLVTDRDDCTFININVPMFVRTFNAHRDRALCTSLAPPQVDSGREEIARPGLPEALRAISQRMRSIDGDRDHMNTSRLTCADTQAAFKLMDMAADALRPVARILLATPHEHLP